MAAANWQPFIQLVSLRGAEPRRHGDRGWRKETLRMRKTEFGQSASRAVLMATETCAVPP